MAAHVQQQIFDAVQTALIAASTAAGSRVYLDRTNELPEDDLPAIDIMGSAEGGDESVDSVAIGIPTMQQRVLSFPIICIARGLTGAPAAARNLAKQVEQTLLASASSIALGGTNIRMAITASRGDKRLDGALPFFSVTQTWQASYHTQAGIPDVVF
jgi:hypothetical protein